MSSEVNNTNTYEFKAEVKQLLDILVHSLYTNKDIFLRELVSNASDALDKIRFESTRGTEVLDKDLPLEIKIGFNEKKNLISITDTGIGMTKEDIINNIGTIAKSGTSEFIKQISQAKGDTSNLIGKFGVGFYSVFMVAEKVELTTRSYKKDEKAFKWISDGLGSYEIIELDDDKIKRGTEIVVHLKDDEKEFAQKYRLESIVKKHSNFIQFPIFVEKERVNNVSALWREPKSNVKTEQYNEFYKFLTYDNDEPLSVIHKTVDAPIQFNALLFIPKKYNDFFGYNRENYGLDLYVRRVLIQHQNKDLLPEYLSFVKGVVDSEDLPLNISRETLQENVIFNKISSSVTSQVLSFLADMAKNDKEKYAEFWKEHGKIFKLGYMDFTNQEKWADLLRFNSSTCNDEKELVSLQEYVDRKKDKQKEIYYVLGNSRQAINSDPHLEIFKSKGIEVFYLYDPIDEIAISSLNKYKDFDIKSVDQADLSKIEKMDDVVEKKDESEKLTKDDEKHFDSLMSKMKEILGEKVKEVRESKRLKDSPAVLVNPDNSMSGSMQKIMQIMNKDQSIPEKIMEVNKNHPLMRNLLKIFKADSNDNYITDVVKQLYESALLLEGYLQDPHELVGRINKLLNQSSDWYTSVKKI